MPTVWFMAFITSIQWIYASQIDWPIFFPLWTENRGTDTHTHGQSDIEREGTQKKPNDFFQSRTGQLGQEDTTDEREKKKKQRKELTAVPPIAILLLFTGWFDVWSLIGFSARFESLFFPFFSWWTFWPSPFYPRNQIQKQTKGVDVVDAVVGKRKASRRRRFVSGLISFRFVSLSRR